MRTFYKIVFVILSVFSCAEKEKIEIYNKRIDKNKKEVIVEIKNNTETNYYLIQPFLSIGYKEGLYDMWSSFEEGYIKNNRLDSIVCSVYNDECCPNNLCFSDKENREIVLLPKKSVKEIKYKYSNDYNYPIDYCHLNFPYNGCSSERSKKMYLALKKKLDSADIIKGYEFYNAEIENK